MVYRLSCGGSSRAGFLRRNYPGQVQRSAADPAALSARFTELPCYVLEVSAVGRLVTARGLVVAIVVRAAGTRLRLGRPHERVEQRQDQTQDADEHQHDARRLQVDE